ncbi:MAG: hypothetical protein JWP97_6645 [Labilithrix sp.]|nr:hypothetical protein [Labilithrix sp.]
MSPPQPHPSPRTTTPKPALVALGALLLVAAAAAAVVFAIHANRYFSIEDDWAREAALSPEARRFGVSLLRRAALQRMSLFGPLAAGLAVVGVVLTSRGTARK